MDVTYKKTYSIELDSTEFDTLIGMLQYVSAHEKDGDYGDKVRDYFRMLLCSEEVNE